MKTCKNCKIEKNESEFYGNNSAKDKLRSVCKKCDLEIRKKNYSKSYIKVKKINKPTVISIDESLTSFEAYNSSGEKFVCLVDSRVWATASGYWWNVDQKGYPSACVDGEHIYLHRFAMGLSRGDGKLVDHKNRTPHDCRLENLRITDRAVNRENQELREGHHIQKRQTTKDYWRGFCKRAGNFYTTKWYENYEEAKEARDRLLKEVFPEVY